MKLGLASPGLRLSSVLCMTRLGAIHPFFCPVSFRSFRVFGVDLSPGTRLRWRWVQMHLRYQRLPQQRPAMQTCADETCHTCAKQLGFHCLFIEAVAHAVEELGFGLYQCLR